MIENDSDQEELQSRLINDQSFHDDLVRLVRDRFQYSYRVMNGRYDAWRKAERQHLAYVDPSEVDKDGSQIFTQARDIIVPYTYAVVQTRLTYFFFAMLSKNPLVPIIGRGPDDFVPAKLMEVIQDYQISETKAQAVMYCFLQDCERYGLGVIRNLWHSMEEEKWNVQRKEVKIFGYKLSDRLVKTRERVVVYEGNLPTNISPFNYFPDPSVNITNTKRMEFWGHTFKRSYNYLRMAEENQEYFNIDKIPMLNKSNQSKTFEGDKISSESDLSKIMNIQAMDSLMNDVAYETKDSGNISMKELEIRLIPKTHKLSKRDFPQEWIISLANDQTIIKCEPLIYPEFTCYVSEANHDYASQQNNGSIDNINGLQDHLSWLFNSHAANVRKIVNDSVIVDPSMVEIKDLLKKSPVKIIRLKEDAWGRPGATGDAIKQLQISDITRGHIQDSQIVMNLIQRVSAATDNIMGMTEEVKRTATETSSTINLATARLKLAATMHFILAIKPWYKAMVTNNQGLLTEERYFRITDTIAQSLGYDPEVIKNRILVGPDKLHGNFDFDIPPLDMPIDKMNMAKIWKELMNDVISNPALQGRFDVFPIFKQFAYNMGITNTKDFEVKTQVLPDEQVQREAEKGNLAPVNEVANINPQQMQQRMQEMANGRQAA